MADESNGAVPEHAPGDCLWCGGSIEPDGRCADCGRVETRVCSCGQELEPKDEACPACGEKWQGVVRVRRRKKHRRLDGAALGRFILGGVFTALMLSAVLNSMIGGLALKNQRSRSTELPEHPGERMALAWETLRDSFTAMGQAAMDRMGGVLIFIMLGVFGAIVGTVLYLRSEGLAMFARDVDRSSPPSRRRKRV